MREAITFCENCRDDVDFTVKEMQLEGKIKGVKYPFDDRVVVRELLAKLG